MSARAMGVCSVCRRHGYELPRGVVVVDCLAAFCEHPSHGGPAREDRGPDVPAAPGPRGPVRVHVGYTRTGRDRWRRFASMGRAVAFCGDVFRGSGVVLSIEGGQS